MDIGFIGVGHMASSILFALSKNKTNHFFINDIDGNKTNSILNQLTNQVNISTYQEIFDKCTYIFLGVKPVDLTNLLIEIKDYIKDQIIISMVAGFNISEITKIIKNIKIIRIMPNTPVIVSSGVTFMTSYNVNQVQINEFKTIYQETGKLYEIEENKMNVVSVLTGSAPAYLDYYLDALSEFGVKHGFTKEESNQYILEMALGVILLNLNSNKSIKELADEVCSPRGSTIEGVNVLLNSDLYKIVDKATNASFEKNKKMF